MRSSCRLSAPSSRVTVAFSISMSSVLAGVSQRNSIICSTNPSKLSSRGVDHSPSPSCCAKRLSCILPQCSSRHSSSTPSRAREERRAPSSRMRLHSASQIRPSSEVSAERKASVRQPRSSAERRACSSSFERSSITWHRTPMSMFRSVTPEMRTNSTNSHINTRLWSLMARNVWARLSPSTPFVKRVIIDEPRSENISAAEGSSAPSAAARCARGRGPPSWVVKTMAKT
mmetsp:Transcript_14492/g.45370  ORF Transcript_14492/g.45370 Transcript_14492/m.45370 type:complete len:230 (+) Transcript_14492:355-1044(+)